MQQRVLLQWREPFKEPTFELIAQFGMRKEYCMDEGITMFAYSNEYLGLTLFLIRFSYKPLIGFEKKKKRNEEGIHRLIIQRCIDFPFKFHFCVN